MQGRSFLPLLEGTAPQDWRKSMYYRYYMSHFKTEPHRGVRTERYKLIHFDRIDQWELYDLDSDPSEMKNLYGRKEHSATAQQLKDELKRLRVHYGDRLDDVGDKPW